MRMQTHTIQPPTRGFSLVELLVVVAIIAVLSSLLLSAIPLVKSTSRTLQCSSNLRQIGISILVYAQDNAGHFPAHDQDDPSSYPYIIEDWAFRTYSSAMGGVQTGLYGGGCSFYDDYLPLGRKIFYCPQGLQHQTRLMNDLRLSHPTFPEVPTLPQRARISNYSYFAGSGEAGQNSRRGPRGTWEAVARSTLIADLMNFGASPYTQTKGAYWNHRGNSSTASTVDISERTGGHMFHFDGRVSWTSGPAELLKHRQTMKGNNSRSHCAIQKNDPP